MSTSLYIKLCLVMSLEYAVWGAWLPVLAARLLGPLKFNGKQTGWIYATLPLACIFSPLVAGHLADKWFNAEWILAASHLIGAVLLLIAAFQTRFVGLFITMFLYSIFYAATLPLVNAVLFANVTNITSQKWVFMWAPVAWAITGYFLTGWRWVFKTAEKGRDCLFLASAISLIMAASCLVLPAATPQGIGQMPILDTLVMLRDVNFLVFIIVSLVVTGLMQFYFLASARFMTDIGIPAKNVPASMAIAQAVQAIATFVLLDRAILGLGFRWTLVIGIFCWLMLYIFYIASRSPLPAIAAQPLHGLAYVLFIITGQVYASSIAPQEIMKSLQAIVFAATTGFGLFVGTQFAGVVMDFFKRDDKFNWRAIFLVPAIIMLISLLIMVAFFKG